MFFRVIDHDRLPDLLAGLASEREVIGPVAKGDAFVFAPLEDFARLRLDYDTTLLPPKKWFLPPAETLMRFRVADNEVLEEGSPVSRRAVVGLHPCDLNALLLLDKVFLDEHEDPYYKAYREDTLLIGVSCMPSETCFCNVWGTDEVHWGFDIFLTDLGDRYYASIRTVRGADLVDRFVESRAVAPEDTAAFQDVQQRFKKAFTRTLDTAQLPVLLDAKYDSPVWDELGERCLSCGACSMSCPTCYCFDVQDRLATDQRSGERVRTWDSCQFQDFAMVAHGHNFRETRASRVRYRFYHKHWGYLSKHGRVLCVGCGRCTRACAVGISPTDVIEALQGGEAR